MLLARTEGAALELRAPLVCRCRKKKKPPPVASIRVIGLNCGIADSETRSILIVIRAAAGLNSAVTKPVPGTLQEGGAPFQTTHWTVVFRARETQSDKSAQKALSDFCESYWPPLYAFLRHRGHASAEAQDLVQGFFGHMLEHQTLSRADREKGKLRTFLLGSFQNYLFNECDRARALKRGGGKQILSIDDHLPEAEASMMKTKHLSDSAAYDLVWASNIVKRAWQQLESAFEAEGKKEWLEVLRPFVAGGGRTPLNQEEAAEKLGVPIATLRTWLSRLRQRYREALRTEVASTVSDPSEVEQELHYLYHILTA
jgi:RNA polymerase sigma-70 factor (ECF subfamily)